MATDRAQVRSYIQSDIKAKFTSICKSENRSESNMIETLILKFIKQYEAEHGPINLPEDDT